MRTGFDRGFRELHRIGELIVCITARDLRVRYKQSLLGLFWAIIQPVSLMIVFVLVLGPRVGIAVPSGEPYSLFVLAGLVPWGFFSSVLTQSANCLVANRSLVTKVYFPREAFPLSCMATSLVDFAISLTALVFLMFVHHISGRWEFVWSASVAFIPAILLVQMLISAGLGMVVAMGNLFYRDVRPILTVALNLGMFVSAVVVPAPAGSGWLATVFACNPMVHIISAYRDCLLYGRFPGSVELGYAALVSVIVFLTGWVAFRRMSFKFAECI